MAAGRGLTLDLAMYHDVHNLTQRGGWEVADAEGKWVAGPWGDRQISKHFAAMMNLGAELCQADDDKHQDEQQGDDQG